MHQTELHLSEKDRIVINRIRARGIHHAREVNRAHILSCLDRGLPESQILNVLGIGRTSLWRTRAAYLQGGIDLAVFDVVRTGRPAHYSEADKAWVATLARSAPPEGLQRWTIAALVRAANKQDGLRGVSRETIRRILTKTSLNLGASP